MEEHVVCREPPPAAGVVAASFPQELHPVFAVRVVDRVQVLGDFYGLGVILVTRVDGHGLAVFVVAVGQFLAIFVFHFRQAPAPGVVRSTGSCSLVPIADLVGAAAAVFTEDVLIAFFVPYRPCVAGVFDLPEVALFQVVFSFRVQKHCPRHPVQHQVVGVITRDLSVPWVSLWMYPASSDQPIPTQPPWVREIMASSTMALL